jgi:hypothetical protein
MIKTVKEHLAEERGWLESQMGAALVAAADAVPVPRPRWRAVRRQVRAARRRRIVGWRASAVGSGVLAICVMLSLSPVLGVAVAQTVYPSRPTLPRLPSPVVNESAVPAPATPTPLVASGEIDVELLAPTLIPLPTPSAEPEA